MQNQNQIQLVQAITKAIAYTENGGKPDIGNPKSGKTGETKSIFQFEPATWDAYSKQVFGKTVPQNADNETGVVTAKVAKWLQNGMTPQQIFSMWNAGPGEPNAYEGKFSDGSSSSGTNQKYGVEYNVPSYVSKATNYMKSFMSEPTQTNQSNQTQTQQTTTPQSSPQIANNFTPQSSGQNPALQNIMALLGKAKAQGSQQQTNQPAQSGGGLLSTLAPQINPVKSS